MADDKNHEASWQIAMRKTVLITGGSRGIGAACVRKFAQEGWNVVFTYNTNAEAAEGVRREAIESIAKTNGADDAEERVISFPLDLRAESSAERLDEILRNAKTYFGVPSVDCCICNAGVSKSGTISQIAGEDIEELISVNLNGALFTAKAVASDMISKREGSIILISSMWGERAASCETVYSATKAGLIGFGKSLASELGPSGVRVNVVSPGLIDTDMNKGYSQDELNEIINKTPLGRIGTPEDVAKGVFFLASQDASFITGQVLGIDGGLTL